MAEQPTENREHRDAADLTASRQALRQKWVEEVQRRAAEHDKRVRRFLLGLSLANWGVAAVAWTISAYLGITSPASIFVYSVLFVIGLVAAIIAILTYLLEKFGHEPPPHIGGEGAAGGDQDEEEEERDGAEAPQKPETDTSEDAARSGGGASAAAPPADGRPAARARAEEAAPRREAAPPSSKDATANRDVRQPPSDAASRPVNAGDDATAVGGAAGDAPPPSKR